MNKNYILLSTLVIAVLATSLFVLSPSQKIAFTNDTPHATSSSEADENILLATSSPSDVLLVIAADEITVSTPTNTKPVSAQTPTQADLPHTDPVPITPTPTPIVKTSGITMAEVSIHNSKSSCWTAISGSVYDVTSFISKHPGGASKILAICGKDGTQAFLSQHEGERKPEFLLATFRIDALAS